MGIFLLLVFGVLLIVNKDELLWLNLVYFGYVIGGYWLDWLCINDEDHQWMTIVKEWRTSQITHELILTLVKFKEGKLTWVEWKLTGVKWRSTKWRLKMNNNDGIWQVMNDKYSMKKPGI